MYFMNIRDNVYYLIESIKNKEGLDKRYMSLEPHKDLDAMVNTSKRIKDILITIKKLNEKNLNADIFYDELFNLITTDLGSKNEFNSFINSCDSAVSIIRENKEILKEIVLLYFENRTISEYTPREWVQAIIDKGSQRGLGNIGENKVIEIAKNLGFIYVKSIDDFFNLDYAVALYSKKIKKMICDDIDFGSQNKDLDVIFKVNNDYVFLEAKHIKEAGGAQDKQIKELIQLMEIKLPSNVYMISFMDGVYSNHLLDITLDEIEFPELIVDRGMKKFALQKYQIIYNLKENKNSFWVNTGGLKKLLEDFKK